MTTLSARVARATAAFGVLAAAIAALPSLDWCPLTEWTAIACESRAEAAACSGSERACEAASASCPLAGSREAAPAECASPAWPLCDPEPDPLPMGDRLWCIRPPVIAIGAKADPLAAPEPSHAFALFVPPPLLAPPAVVLLARAAPLPRPPLLRGAHAPPQPRAPPCA